MITKNKNVYHMKYIKKMNYICNDINGINFNFKLILI